MTWTTPESRTSGEIPLDVWNEQIIDNLLYLHEELTDLASDWGITGPAAFTSTPTTAAEGTPATTALWNDVVVTGIDILRSAVASMSTALDLSAPSLPSAPSSRSSGEVPSSVYNDELIDNLLALKDALDAIVDRLIVGSSAQIGTGSETLAPPDRPTGCLLVGMAATGSNLSGTPSGWTEANTNSTLGRTWYRTASGDASDDLAMATSPNTNTTAVTMFAVQPPAGGTRTWGSIGFNNVGSATAAADGTDIVFVSGYYTSGTPTLSPSSGTFTLEYEDRIAVSGGTMYVAVYSRSVTAGSVSSTGLVTTGFTGQVVGQRLIVSP